MEVAQLDLIHLLDCLFEVRRPIRSLPEWHGARWHAWLRCAARNAGFALEDAVRGILPLRKGTRPFLPREIVRLRLVIDADDLAHLPPLIHALGRADNTGEFSAGSLRLLGLEDAIAHASLLPGSVPVPLAQAIGAEVELLLCLPAWTLLLVAPMRLPLPSGDPARQGAMHKYCLPDFFTPPGHMRNFFAHMRCPSPLDAPDHLGLARADLRWEEMRYNRQRHMVLGGLVGELVFAGPPPATLAAALVAGQYVGAGKNPRFGFGYWLIPELHSARIVSPLPEF